MNRIIIIIILILFLSIISCQNGHQKEKVNNGIVFDTIQFPLRILPDNGWFLRLYPNSKYDYVYFSGFSFGLDTIENGTYKLNDKRIVFISENKKSNFHSMNYYLYKKSEDEFENENCIIDKSDKYCLIIETE